MLCVERDNAFFLKQKWRVMKIHVNVCVGFNMVQRINHKKSRQKSAILPHSKRSGIGPQRIFVSTIAKIDLDRYNIIKSS